MKLIVRAAAKKVASLCRVRQAFSLEFILNIFKSTIRPFSEKK